MDSKLDDVGGPTDHHEPLLADKQDYLEDATWQSGASSPDKARAYLRRAVFPLLLHGILAFTWISVAILSSAVAVVHRGIGKACCLVNSVGLPVEERSITLTDE